MSNTSKSVLLFNGVFFLFILSGYQSLNIATSENYSRSSDYKIIVYKNELFSFKLNIIDFTDSTNKIEIQIYNNTNDTFFLDDTFWGTSKCDSNFLSRFRLSENVSGLARNIIFSPIFPDSLFSASKIIRNCYYKMNIYTRFYPDGKALIDSLRKYNLEYTINKKDMIPSITTSTECFYFGGYYDIHVKNIKGKNFTSDDDQEVLINVFKN